MIKNKKIDVSIIIVNYHVKKELFACIQSVIDTTLQTSYELIVVDNDEIKTIRKELLAAFPEVVYMPNQNEGFGQANNKGADMAKGEYLFFLNPDTEVYPKCIDQLIGYLRNHKKTGIVAPLLYDDKNNLYPQGAHELTPIRSLFTSSFLHTLFPNNPIAKKYWMLDEWDRKKTKEVGSVPGTAFVIRRAVFERINGFDEKFFLYFEELDLCKRVKALGWKIVMYPPAKVYHALGRSTSKVAKTKHIFQQSRFYYFRKHYGLISAIVTESITRISKNFLLFSCIFLFALAASLYRLSETMIFIGDQGWYFLSARDMLLYHTIPLVGIPSSHPWLHQGAYWTYLLAPVFSIFGFNPLNGAYLSIGFHLLTLCLVFLIARKMFSENMALIAALLYASSPLVLLHVRMPYHTTPIPLLSLLLYFALYQWVKGKPYYFPASILLLSLLYNFEIATFLLTIVFLIILFFGLLKKTEWFKSILTKRIILLSIAAFVIPMAPMLLFDITHGFPQTVLFLAWVGYKILVFFGYPPLSAEGQSVGYTSLLLFLGGTYKNLIYSPSNLVSFTIALFSFGYFGKSIVHQLFTRSYKSEMLILALIVVISVIGILATKTASAAYLPILYPLVILITALFFAKLIAVRPALLPVILAILIIMAANNNYYLVQENYFTTKGVTYADRVEVIRKIVSDAGNSRYNLIGKGIGSEHESFLMNYRYLAWLEGNEPVDTKQHHQYSIEETRQGILVTKEYD